MTQAVMQGVSSSFKVVGVNKFGSDVAAPAPVDVVLDVGGLGTVTMNGDSFDFVTDEVKDGNFNVTAGALKVVEPYTVAPDTVAVGVKVVAA